MNIYGRQYIEEKVSSKFAWGPFFEMMNPKNWGSSPIYNGQFEKVRPRILKKVDWCKSKDDIDYLLKDARMGKSQLLKIKSILEEALKNPDNAKQQYEEMRKRNKKGLTSKSIDDHIEWINTVYIPAIKEKAKEFK